MSQSISCTMATIKSPILEDWLSKNKGISIKSFAEMFAAAINGDGSGSECITSLSEINSFAEALLNRFADIDPDICTFIEENANEIDDCSVATIYCAAIFPGDAPELNRLIYQSGYADFEYVLLEEVEEELIYEAFSEELFTSPFEFISSITWEDFSKAFELMVEEIDIFEDEDCDEEE